MTLDELRQMVEDIQQLMAYNLEPLEEELIDLAARHDDLVAVFSQRLSKVEALLNKGLRSEAIALAEQEPNLNDVVTVLDFPEFDAWNDCLLQHGIQPVRELPADIAEELNQAYAVSAPVEQLLNRYRTQSLARAPLAERVVTLRQLAAQDTANTQWKHDVQKFETHRVREMMQELQAAAKVRDLETVERLDEELSSHDWSIKVPANLRKSARDAHEKLRRQNAREELEPLCQRLSDAYADFDKPLATRLQQRFLALTQILNLPPTDPLYDIAGPALDWLQEEETRTAAEADFALGKTQLQTALDGNTTTITELERLYAQTTRHGHTLPPVLENRLADRIELLKANETRKRVALLTGIVAASAVAMLAVVLVVRQISFQNAVAGHVNQARQLLTQAQQSGDLQPVQDYFQQIETEDRRFLEAPDLLGLKEQFNAAVTREDGRRQQLEQLIGNAVQLMTATPDWNQFAEADAALAQAAQVARNPAEQARVLNAQGQLGQARAALQSGIDRQFEASLEQLVNQVAALPSDSETGYAAVLSGIRLLQDRERVSPELKTSLSALQVKVQQQQSMVVENLNLARQFQKITDACGQPKAYSQALQDFAKASPGTQRAADLLQVVRTDAALWEGVEQWNSIRQRLDGVLFSSLSAEKAQTLVRDFEDFLKTSGPYPGRMQMDQRLPALQQIAARSGGPLGTSQEQVDRMFAARPISDAWQILARNDVRYFATQKPEPSGDKITFDFYTTTTGSQTETKSLAKTSVQGASFDNADFWKSPQMRLTERLRSNLNDRIQTDFEDAILLGVSTILDAEEVDPILRFLLIERLLKTGSEGSLLVQQAVMDVQQKLTSAGVSKLTNWAAPEDQRAREERDRARSFLKEHKTALVQNLQAALAARQALQDQPVGPEMRWVGWLHRDLQGQWAVALRDDLVVRESTTLQALRTNPASSAPEFYPVAVVTKTAVVSVPATEVSDAVQGHPVYREIVK